MEAGVGAPEPRGGLGAACTPVQPEGRDERERARQSSMETAGGMKWRRGSESNRRMGLLQSPALPLGYPAMGKILPIHVDWRGDNGNSTASQGAFGLV
jgi:hypothetical protein